MIAVIFSGNQVVYNFSRDLETFGHPGPLASQFTHTGTQTPVSAVYAAGDFLHDVVVVTQTGTVVGGTSGTYTPAAAPPGLRLVDVGGNVVPADTYP